MRKDECTNCGHVVPVVRGSYQFTDCGLSSVILQGIEIIECNKCGNVDPIIPHVDDLMRTIAIAVILKPYTLKGEDIRFLRKHLDMTGEQFSRLMDIDKTTLSKWENDADHGAQSDRLIRFVALAYDSELKEKLEMLLSICPQIKETACQIGIHMFFRNLGSLESRETVSYEYA